MLRNSLKLAKLSDVSIPCVNDSVLLKLLVKPSVNMPFYAVKRGRTVGVYNTWSECQEQVVGFSAPKFKKFETKEEALAFIGDVPAPAAVVEESTTDFEPPKNLKNEDVETRVKNLEVLVYKMQGTIAKLSRQILDLQNSSTSLLGQSAKRSLCTSTDEITKPKASRLEDIEEENRFTGKSFEEKDSIHVYTDGGCFFNGRNGAKAGIGVYWGPDDIRNVSEKLEGRPTNNRAEIHAAIKAIAQAKEQGIQNLTLHTDSQFLINGITKWIKGWKKKQWHLSTGEPVKNKEDFEELDKTLSGINVKWMYVKGHSGDTGNDAVDRLAKAGANKTT